MSDIKLKIAQNKLEIVERENEILRERLYFLEKLFMPRLNLPVEWEFSPMQHKVLSAMLGSKGMLHKDNYVLLLYQDRNSEKETPDPKIVDVWVCKIRAIVKKFNIPIEIQTVWGGGYVMPPDTIQYLKQFIHTPDITEYNNLKHEQKKAG